MIFQVVTYDDGIGGALRHLVRPPAATGHLSMRGSLNNPTMEASHMQVVGRREGRTIKTEQ